MFISFRTKTIILGLFAALPVIAQDVTVNDPVWMFDTEAPDVLPIPAHRLRPSFPSDARKTDQIGYAFIVESVPGQGEAVIFPAVGSQIVYERSVMDERSDFEMKPAQSQGKAVNGAIWRAIIFNPKSASTKGLEATPRLLQVTPVFMAGQKVRALGVRPAILVTMTVDATGLVTQVDAPESVAAEYVAHIRSAAKAWRFAPARHLGQPIEAAVSFPAVFLTRLKPDFAQRTSPVAIKQTQAYYPRAMEWSRLRGEVTVHYTVAADGTVHDAVVEASNNPGFDDAALEAVQQWKYKPGTVNGKPVGMTVAVVIVFDFDDQSIGQDAFSLEGGNQSKLPEQYRYDTAPHLRGTALPIYPYEQLRDSNGGTASVLYMIGSSGRVTDLKVIKASSPEFGLALAAAVATFEFDPALRGGKPTPTLLRQEQRFSFDMYTGAASSESAMADHDLIRSVTKHPERLVNARTLDKPLRPISQRKPVFPPNLRKSLSEGNALLEVVVDEDGHLRIPKVLSASEPSFGYAAVQAVSTWRFEPPKVGGKSVMTLVQIPLHFMLPKS